MPAPLRLAAIQAAEACLEGPVLARAPTQSGLLALLASVRFLAVHWRCIRAAYLMSELFEWPQAMDQASGPGFGSTGGPARSAGQHTCPSMLMLQCVAACTWSARMPALLRLCVSWHQDLQVPDPRSVLEDLVSCLHNAPVAACCPVLQLLTPDILLCSAARAPPAAPRSQLPALPSSCSPSTVDFIDICCADHLRLTLMVCSSRITGSTPVTAAGAAQRLCSAALLAARAQQRGDGADCRPAQAHLRRGGPLPAACCACSCASALS